MSELKTTQHQQIAEYINKHGSITPDKAWNTYGISKLSTRISEMRRKKGMNIHIEYERGVNRSGVVSRYARYSWGEKIMGIFYTKQRRMILEENNIPFTVDVYLRFVFPNAEVEKQAIKLLKPKHKMWRG